MNGVLYFDGASKGNPGKARVGVVIIIGNKKYTYAG